MKSVYELHVTNPPSDSNATIFNQINTNVKGPNYALALKKDQSKINNYYTNARYAPVGNETVGQPFPFYKDYGGRMTMWNSSASAMSTIKKQMNLPTDNTAFRNGITNDAINLGNDGLTSWVYGTQTLANHSFDNRFCTSDTDCSQFGPNYTCNANYENWPDAKGNQSGSICTLTHYPEVDSGNYMRANAINGGIGKACKLDTDCNQQMGYSCNNQTDIVGKNIQQTGYCAQTYKCPNGETKFLGTPYNSGIPQPPLDSQNNFGTGYGSKEECMAFASAQQSCVPLQGRYYATYPGYCGVGPSLRKGTQGQGALRITSMVQKSNGFTIPQFGPIASSTFGGADTAQQMQRAFNAQGSDSMASPLQYSLNINPRVTNEAQ